jgi:hypothetical protein
MRTLRHIRLTAALAFPLMGTATAASAVTSDATAAGTVFYPNPVQQLGDQTLTDRKDADYAALQPAYRKVTLTDLDGSGSLAGRYVVVKSETGKAAQAVNGDFPAYHRDADQFEQVMGYYWVTTAQHYIQHLGFGSTLRPVNHGRSSCGSTSMAGTTPSSGRTRRTSHSVRAGWTTPRTPR